MRHQQHRRNHIRAIVALAGAALLATCANAVDRDDKGCYITDHASDGSLVEVYMPKEEPDRFVMFFHDSAWASIETKDYPMELSINSGARVPVLVGGGFKDGLKGILLALPVGTDGIARKSIELYLNGTRVVGWMFHFNETETFHELWECAHSQSDPFAH